MRDRNLGRSGLLVSLVGLGCNNFGGRCDLDATRQVVHKALDLGITLFDTADVYPITSFGVSEDFLGRVLGPRRREVVLATKFGYGYHGADPSRGASRRHIITSVEASLTRLATDWIDLFQLHEPDPRTPIEETLRALDDLVRQGKVRYIGCSNMAAWQAVEAAWTSRHHGLAPFVSAQEEYSLVARGIEAELLPAIEAYGLGLLPFFPLASGLLTGKYTRAAPPPANARLAGAPTLAQRFLTEANWQVIEALEGFCAVRGRTLLELAMSWLAARPAVASIIAGATRPEQVEANVKAVGWALTPEDLAEIDRLSLNG